MNLPIYRRTSPPSELALTAPKPPSRWMFWNRRQLQSLVQQSRIRSGLKPLKSHRDLSKIAQDYAKELASEQYIAHTSTHGRLLSHRIQESKLNVETLYENLAVGFDLEEIHDRLMNSPAHRSAILDQSISHFGIGVSEHNGLLYGVELFAKVMKRLNPHEAKMQAYRLIQAYRKTHQLNRLPHAVELEDVAQNVAHALMIGQCRPHEVHQHCLHLLQEKYQINYSVESVLFQLTQISHFPQEDRWLANQVKSIGLGLAQGGVSEPIWVVVLLRLRERSNSTLLDSPLDNELDKLMG